MRSAVQPNIRRVAVHCLETERFRSGGAGDTRALLARGEGDHLYRLRSWVIVNGEERALLAPEVSLHRIANAIWNDADQPIQSRWVASERACAAVAREI